MENISVKYIQQIDSLRNQLKELEDFEGITEEDNFNGFIQLLYDLLDHVDNPQVRDQISKILELAEDTSSLSSDNERFKQVEKQIFEYAYFLTKNVERNELQNIFNNINKIEKLLLERKKIAE